MKWSERFCAVFMVNAALFFMLAFHYLMKLQGDMISLLKVSGEVPGFSDAWVLMISGLTLFVIGISVCAGIGYALGFYAYKGSLSVKIIAMKNPRQLPSKVLSNEI